MAKILVTGVNGFVGHHLAQTLKQQKHTVYGSGLDANLDPSLSSLVDAYFGNCDLTNSDSVSKLPLNEIDAVINLAGLAQVGASFDQAERYLKINVEVHTNVVEGLKHANNTRARVIAVSTGAVYDANQAMPISESGKLITEGSPYALSKIAMEEALQQHIDQGMDIVIVRPFNHIGPGQLPGFLVPDLLQQVLQNDIITVGNLTTERDYTDVRDVVEAYALLATTTTLPHRIYNVCSGRSITGEKILETILEAASKTNAKVEVDPSRLRPNDPPKIVGDNSRLKQDTGWKPTIQLQQTIADFVASQK